MVYFPLFISLEEKQIVVIGGGSIAARRVEKLLPFGCAVTVIAPSASPVICRLAETGTIRWERRPYAPGDCDDAFLVLAATDDPAVNEAVFREAKARGVPVNTADCKYRCDFYFPGLVVTDDLVVGVTASGGDHGLVRETTEQLKQFLEGGGTHGNAQ